MRLLAHQLTPSEDQWYLEQRNAYLYRLSGHAIDRMKEKGITPADVRLVFKDSYLVEVGDQTGALCALWRTVDGVCVVLDLDHRQIKTVFLNHPNDNHVTLDYSKYGR